MIYLDHNATSPLDPRVAAAMGELLRSDELGGNPSSVHGPGRRARAVVETARREVAAAVGVEPLGVTFTSGGTEADNLAILGTSRALRAAGRPWGLLTSPLEHPAVTRAAERLEREGGCVVWVSVDAQGRISPDEVAAQLERHPDVGLVSFALVHHELGNLYDLAALAAAARSVRAELLVHSDAVQALGKVDVDLEELGVDLLSVSAHKIGGPQGVGALVHRAHARLEPLLHGGHQERGRRPGTEGVLAIHGFGAAAGLVRAEGTARAARVRTLGERLRAGLAALPGVELLGDSRHQAGNTAATLCQGAEGELVLMALDLEGFAVSTGSACSAGTLAPSPSILALGRSPEEARCVVRISLGPSNTEPEVDALLAALPPILDRIRAASEGAA